jgi:hypothetical protein
MARIWFEEKQRFNQWWVWLLTIGVVVLSMGTILGQAIETYQNGFESEEKAQELIIVLIILFFTNALIIWLLLSIHLDTRIDSRGVHYRFSPFINQWKTISKRDIKEFDVGSYSPLKDYGGWGLRYGMEGKALNVRGNQGLKLHYGEGKKLLIGTQMPAALEKAMTELMDRREEI